MYYIVIILVLNLSQILGYGYPYMPPIPYQNPYGGFQPYPMSNMPYPMPYQNPYQQNINPQGFTPYSGGKPYMNPYQGYGSMPYYPTYVQNYGVIPTEIIDEPNSKELVDAKVKVLLPNTVPNKKNGTSPMLSKEKGPYGYVAPPPFKILGINSTNDVKSTLTGPIQTSSISKSPPSQTVITRTIDPKTGAAKVEIKSDAEKMEDNKNSTNYKNIGRTLIGKTLYPLKLEENKNGTKSTLRNRSPTVIKTLTGRNAKK